MEILDRPADKREFHRKLLDIVTHHHRFLAENDISVRPDDERLTKDEQLALINYADRECRRKLEGEGLSTDEVGALLHALFAAWQGLKES